MKSRAEKNNEHIEKLVDYQMGKMMDEIPKERLSGYLKKIINSTTYAVIMPQSQLRNKITKKVGKLSYSMDQRTKETIFLSLQKKLDYIAKKTVLKKKNEILFLLSKISNKKDQVTNLNYIKPQNPKINNLIEEASKLKKDYFEKTNKQALVATKMDQEIEMEIETQDIMVLDLLRLLKNSSSSFITKNSDGNFEFTSDVRLPIIKKKLILELAEISQLVECIEKFTLENEKSINCQIKNLLLNYSKTQIHQFKNLIEQMINSYKEDNRIFEEQFPKKLKIKKRTFSLMELLVIFQEPKNKLSNLAVIIQSCFSINNCMILSAISCYSKLGGERMKNLTNEILKKIILPFENFCLEWMNNGVVVDPMEEFFIRTKAKINKIWDEDCWIDQTLVSKIIDEEITNLIFQIGRETRFRKRLNLLQVKKKKILRFDFIDTNPNVNKAVLAKYTEGFKKKLVDEYLTKNKFEQLIVFIKKTYFMQMGDFIDEMIHKMEDLLNQPAEEVHFHEVMPLFRSVVDISSLKVLKSPFSVNLGIKLLEKMSGDQGWDIFTFELKVINFLLKAN